MAAEDDEKRLAEIERRQGELHAGVMLAAAGVRDLVDLLRESVASQKAIAIRLLDLEAEVRGRK